MGLHNEIEFENDICQHLAANGWLYSPNDNGYDRTLALFPEDVLAWVKETQPDVLESLAKTHGASTDKVLLNRVRDVLNTEGTLEVLRIGVDALGLKNRIKLAQFKPALAMNPEIVSRYSANRLRIMRQVHYSTHNENSIDLVLFVNGIPVATAELKTDFTQSVQDAIDQYRKDRHPRPKGKTPEPLLSFPSGAIVHFAISNSEVQMTTLLKGDDTGFLPFNQGDHGGKGNPVNPTGGHRTAYLWETIWERENWLEILGRFLIGKKNKKKQLESYIFPRFHQWDATRKLQAAVLAEGPGGKYLIQHSAGSGKTNSIAWTAHFLADLHDASHKKVFDAVLVISDKTVIDTQLQDAIFSFERTAGVVATIKGESSSKSSELAAALSGQKKIVVCTIQTFPALHKKMSELVKAEGKKFAVIADEAHSSQTGEAASKLKAVLSADALKDLGDGGEVSSDDILAAQMEERASDIGVSYIAFTATPKAKTMELFGRRPDPNKPAGKDNLPAAFHVYSMRQAIEEGFILDVLRNYTPYKLAFKLANEGKEFDEKEVERSTAMKGLMGWVRLHPYNIAQKVEIVVEHYREHVAPLLNGQAKAMVVVNSRLEAVRWQIAINRYITSKNYPIRTLVAFSGEVSDPDSGPDPFTEGSSTLNPNLKGRDIREAFKGSDYQILLVANKFQTGFDEPLLCGMYIDKRLAGIQAVQTLSRLNRAHPGKDTTYILDFVNNTDEILEAFKLYHTTAELADVTDPNLVYTLRAKLDSKGFYDDFEIERVVNVELKDNATQKELVAALEPVFDRLMRQFKQAKEALKAGEAQKDQKAIDAAQNELNALILFKSDMAAFQRIYTFLSQIFNYGNTDIEKRFLFYKRLLPLLEFGREREGIDLSKVVMTHHNLKSQGKRNLSLSQGDSPKLEPLTEAGSGQVQEKQKAMLAEIISKLNELFTGDFTDDDEVGYARTVRDKMLESQTLQMQAINNSPEQFASSPDLKTAVVNAAIESYDVQTALSSQLLASDETLTGFLQVLLRMGLYDLLRNRTLSKSTT